MRNLRELIFGRFIAHKPFSIFISDSIKCPCSQSLRLAQQLHISNIYHIDSIEFSGSERLTKSFKSSNNMLIYAHGDERRLAVFYKRLEIVAERHVYIPDSWWSTFPKRNSTLYFHVCNGSQILNGNSVLKSNFPSWVSYNKPVISFYSDSERIRYINQKLLQSIVISVGKSRNSMAMKSSIESVYKDIESDLYNYEIPGKVNERRTPIVGFTTIVAAIGNNVRALKCSQEL